MDLSILIVNYRSWKSLSECLDSLKSMGRSVVDYEVIIVDNDSDDGVIDDFEKKYEGYHFIRNQVNGGYANGCNLGAGIAKGKYFLFLNPDTALSGDSVFRLYDRMKLQDGLILFSCRQHNAKGKELIAFGVFPDFGTLTGHGRALSKLLFGKGNLLIPGTGGNCIHPDWVSGSVMMISKESFRTTGGFDEDFWMYYEDTDFCRRIRNLGGDIFYYTDLWILHNHGGSSRISLKTTALTKTEVIISHHVYISKHFNGLKAILLQAILVSGNTVSGILLSVIGLILFFRPEILVRTIIFARLIRYYAAAIQKGKWISPRSVNYNTAK